MSHAGRWIALGLVLAAAAAGGAWLWLSPRRQAATTLHLPGVVEVQEVRLGSKVGGRVREVLVPEGSLVEAGTPLVTFEVPELLAQRAQWDAKLRIGARPISRKPGMARGARRSRQPRRPSWPRRRGRSG